MLPFLSCVLIFSEISVIPYYSSSWFKYPHFPVNGQNSFILYHEFRRCTLMQPAKAAVSGFRKDLGSVCVLPQ